MAKEEEEEGEGSAAAAAAGGRRLCPSKRSLAPKPQAHDAGATWAHAQTHWMGIPQAGEGGRAELSRRAHPMRGMMPEVARIAPAGSRNLARSGNRKASVRILHPAANLSLDGQCGHDLGRL